MLGSSSSLDCFYVFIKALIMTSLFELCTHWKIQVVLAAVQRSTVTFSDTVLCAFFVLFVLQSGEYTLDFKGFLVWRVNSPFCLKIYIHKPHWNDLTGKIKQRVCNFLMKVCRPLKILICCLEVQKAEILLI